jgi:hypothetical protein
VALYLRDIRIEIEAWGDLEARVRGRGRLLLRLFHTEADAKGVREFVRRLEAGKEGGDRVSEHEDEREYER